MHIPRFFALVLSWFLLAGGCSSGRGSSDCEQRSGEYRFSYSERSGTCGEVADQIVTIDGQPAAPARPCTAGRIEYSADNCDVTNVDLACPEDAFAAGATSVTNGKYVWSHDASAATGLVTIVVRDASRLPLCQSSYDVEVTRP